MGKLKIDFYRGVAKYRWGISLVFDFYDGFGIAAQLGPFYFGVDMWRVGP